MREGLVVLLQAWGARVVCLRQRDGGRGRWLAEGARPSEPDLLLVDYRLPQGRPACRRWRCCVRTGRGQGLPAIMVTGS